MEDTTNQNSNEQTTDASPAVDLAAENAELRATLRTERARAQLAGSLVAAGARTPELLLDAAAAAMQFGDDGTLSNAEELLAGIRARFPEQFRTHRSPSIDGGAGRTTPAPLTREALAKMTPAEIAKLDWAAVRAVLSER